MTDLSFMYSCGKCNRNFRSPDHLKNHEIPCRGKRPTEEAALMSQHLSVKDLAGLFSPSAEHRVSGGDSIRASFDLSSCITASEHFR